MPKPASRHKPRLPKARRRPPAKPEPGRLLARPGDLLPAEERQLLGMITIGTPVEDACHAIGLRPARFYAWMDERDEEPDVEAFRAKVLRADGQGVAQSVKILWDGGRTVDLADGAKKVDVSKTICEQHRFLLQRRRPQVFSGTPGGLPGRGTGGGPGGRVGEPVEQDVAEQIVATLEAAGVELPPEVRAAVGLGS